jgi:hypothetical protein
MRLYFFKTQTGAAVAKKNCRNEAHAITEAAIYADWSKNPITIHTANQHGEMKPCAGVLVYPSRDWKTGRPLPE